VIAVELITKNQPQYFIFTHTYLFLVSASFTTVFHLIPVFFPLFSPTKRFIALYADFRWKIFFFDAFHTCFKRN
jgi:hypothetical protein